MSFIPAESPKLRPKGEKSQTQSDPPNEELPNTKPYKNVGAASVLPATGQN